MDVVTISDLRAWADAVIALPVSGPLPTRVVLVPGEAHAHALRVELVHRAPAALLGTRFLTMAAAARAVLDVAEVSYRVGEEERRRLRVRKLVRAGLSPAWLRAEDVRGHGWEDALAASVEQLEAAGLEPEDLEQIGDARAGDVAAMWRALDADAGESWTVYRIVRAAAALLEASPATWPYPGPVLAAVDPGIDPAHARFVRAVPGLVLGVVPGRAHRRSVDRARALLGDQAAAQLAAYEPESSRSDELGVLVEHVFETPARLAAAGRRRSRGPDGSVTLEVHAGVDEELDATARWVADEVFAHGTRLQDVAVLVPRPEPLGVLVAHRIEALPWPEGARPVHLACGRPAATTAAGARLLAMLRALQSYLPVDAVCALIPRLRVPGMGGHLSPAQARMVVDRLAIVGGSAERPADALRWRERLGRIANDERLGGVTASLGALVDVAAQVIAGARLGPVWRAVRELAREHLILPGDPATILDPLHAEVVALAADPVTAGVTGVEAIELIAERLGAVRLRETRFGEPAIFVGTIDEAAGLRFAAVRVLGLAESVFPGTLREDALLPPELRGRLPAHSIVHGELYAATRLHALEQVLRDISQRVVLSTARSDIDGTEREPAALFVDVAAALGRPNAVTGAPAPMVPSLADLERDALAPARVEARARRAAAPLTMMCWLDEVTSGAPVPSVWRRTPVTDPAEVSVRARTMHGVLGAGALVHVVPGTHERTPVSASALRQLLACPQRFLLERVLRFRPRTERADSHRIAALAYGSLLHRVLEAFSTAHGIAFGLREGDLAGWLAIADHLATTAFDAFLDEYPLQGEGAIEAERHRLRRDVCRFIEDDWAAGRPRRFVGVERSFGEQGGRRIETAAGPLWISGRIDRIDVDHGITLVRDLKTGRPQPREGVRAGPSVDVDLQLAIYVAVTEQLSTSWGLPAEVAGAYAYTDALAPVRERGFVDDRRELRAAGQHWLEVAREALRDGAYVRSPASSDCRICPFAPVCDDEPTHDPAPASAAVRRFLELRT